MDTLTHLILGHTMGGAAAGAGAGAAAYWGALVGNSLPDIDVPIGYALRRGWAFHRKHTHTLPGILVLSALATGAISLAFPGAPALVTFGWTLLGAAVHVAFDCLNVWGARILWPYSDRRFGFAILFIIDPYILAMHGLAALAAPRGAPWAMASAWIATVVYIALRLALWMAARRALPSGARQTLVPLFGRLNRWRYVVETEDAIEKGIATAIPGRRIPTERIAKERPSGDR